jgi:TonB family protein
MKVIFAETMRVCGQLRKIILQAVAVALTVVLALPAGAADARAIKTRVPPVYPEIAKRMRICGEVRIEARISADGKVKSTREVSGNRLLGEAAEQAVHQWTFEPGTGEATVTVAVNFSLD